MRRRRPGERAGLDRNEVLHAARKVVRRHGVGGLSLRKLAGELGVAPNAVYGYFDDKQALLDAVLDDLLQEILPPVSPDWRGALGEILLSTRRLLVAHEELIPMFLSRPGAGPNAQQLGQIMHELLGRAGLPPHLADEALSILVIFALGFAAHEAPRRHRKPHAAGRHPDDATFARGLAWLLDGVAAERKRIE